MCRSIICRFIIATVSKHTHWRWHNLDFRFPKGFATFTHSCTPKSLTTDNLGICIKNVSEQHLSWAHTHTKNEESLDGSTKTQMVYRSLFSCQERCLWRWHAVHRKLWDSRTCLAPRRHIEILVVFHLLRNNHLLIYSLRNIHWYSSLYQLLFQFVRKWAQWR